MQNLKCVDIAISIFRSNADLTVYFASKYETFCYGVFQLLSVVYTTDTSGYIRELKSMET